MLPKLLAHSSIKRSPALAVSVHCLSVNVAVTDLSASIVTVVGFVVPVTAPLQPVKFELAAGLAVSCTTVPQPYVAWFGLFATVPLPFPAVATVSVCWSIAKLAAMVWFAVTLVNV